MNNLARAWIQEHFELRKFLDIPNTAKDGQVLEIGCGNGFGATLITKYFFPKKIYGIDLDPKMIAKAQKRGLKNTEFATGNATRLVFPGNSFDAIFDFGVIHHIPDWQICLKELHRVLKREGQMYIEDFSIDSFECGLGRLVRPYLYHPYARMYWRKDFINYVRTLGFTVVKQKIYRPLGLISYFVLVAKK